MELNKLIDCVKQIYQESNKTNEEIVSLDEIYSKFNSNLSKIEFEKYLKSLKESEYCLPLIKALIKIQFITLPSWGTKKKSYRINGLNYTHISLYKC